MYATAVAATEWWPPVLAVLGGALIVAVYASRNARAERKEARDRLARELEHDRNQREIERSLAAQRFEQQLAQDRDLRTTENEAAAERLSTQLRHDRQLRDRDHVRQVLGPIAARFVGSSLVVTLISDVADARKPENLSQRSVLVPTALAEAHRLVRDLYVDAIALAMLVGENDSIVDAIAVVARNLGDATDIVEQWQEGKISDEDLDARFANAKDRCSQAEGHVLREAFALAGAELDRLGSLPTSPPREGS
ncbi:MAG TPA: hypothetical protein VGP17_04700 [Solirubrobacteraceae bacterium]|jgi:hypothetical protein|nr:hypothetical protein [Solirubrobacteraceae bacterium]